MVKHIVMWNIQEGLDKEATIRTLKEKLEALPATIGCIRELELGAAFNDSPSKHDVVLYSAFDTREDMEAYIVHPDHQAVVSYVRSVVCDRVDVDYEI